MASPELSLRVEKVLAYPLLSEMSAGQRRELQEGCSRPTASKICRAGGRRRLPRPSTTGRSSGKSTAP